MKVGQFVKVKVNARGKTEIGHITAILGEELSVQTKSGFEVKSTVSAVTPALLVVLDLNGVLVNRSGRKHIAVRPHLEEFFTYIFKNFIVGVWSSCERRNGQSIIETAFGDDWTDELSFQMFRDECTPAPTEESPYATVKNLSDLWVKFHGVFDQTNTIIIDDSAEKCSHLRNALCPLPFEAGDDTDQELLRLIEVLKNIVSTGNFFEILDAEQTAFAGSLKALQEQGKFLPTTPMPSTASNQTMSTASNQASPATTPPMACMPTPNTHLPPPPAYSGNGGSPALPKPRSATTPPSMNAGASPPTTPPVAVGVLEIEKKIAMEMDRKMRSMGHSPADSSPATPIVDSAIISASFDAIPTAGKNTPSPTATKPTKAEKKAAAKAKKAEKAEKAGKTSKAPVPKPTTASPKSIMIPSPKTLTAPPKVFTEEDILNDLNQCSEGNQNDDCDDDMGGEDGSPSNRAAKKKGYWQQVRDKKKNKKAAKENGGAQGKA